MDKRIKF